MEFDYENNTIANLLKIKREVDPPMLSDVSTPYNLGNAKINKPHDKIFKMVLGDKKQVVELLNRILKPTKKLYKNDIERYNTEHISYMFQESESDIIYKMKNKEIYFLIEHQRTIDYNMPQRILGYELEIIKEATRGKKMTKNSHKLPTIIPIVIYTGSKKWNVEKYIKDCQETLDGVKTLNLGEYIVIDVNTYKNEDLKNDSSFFSKMLLLEKLENQEDIAKLLSNMTKTEKDKDNRTILKSIIAFIMKEKLPPEEIEKLLRSLESEGKDMVMEVLEKESQRQRNIGIRQGMKQGISQGISQGIKQGILETARELLKFGMNKEDIQKVTKLTKKEIEKL